MKRAIKERNKGGGGRERNGLNNKRDKTTKGIMARSRNQRSNNQTREKEVQGLVPKLHAKLFICPPWHRCEDAAHPVHTSFAGVMGTHGARRKILKD